MIAAAKGDRRRRRRRRPDPRQLCLDYESAARLARWRRQVAAPPPAIAGPERLGDVLARLLRGRL